MYLPTLFLTLFICNVISGSSDIGYFWQITDVHFDPTYNPNGEYQSCEIASGSKKPTFKYGDYLCDSPYALVKSAVDTMKINTPSNLDFILWTGDSVPHVEDSYLSAAKDYEIISNVTLVLRNTFPDTSILPSIGNHDHFHYSQVPVRTKTDYYEKLATVSHWDSLLDNDTLKQFKNCGYYSTVTKQGLELICLNTVLWYNENNVTIDMTDPCNQFSWLEKKLQQAVIEDRQVILFGHIPPGFMARSESVIWYRPAFNVRFNNILVRYADIITSSIFGHEHTDAFRIIENTNSAKSGSVMFMAPSVTPWESTLPSVGGNNPAVRLYSYNRTSGRIINYVQYFMDLKVSTVADRAVWEVEYLSNDTYGELTSYNMMTYLNTMLINNTVFSNYFLLNSVSKTQYTNDICGESCIMRHYCSAMCIDESAYHLCLKIPIVIRKLAVYIIVIIVIASLILLSCCIGCLYCICCRRGNHSERLRLVTSA